MNEIEPTCFVLVITEYGKEVIKYCDKNKDRFTQRSKEMITEHIQKYSFQAGTNGVKNVNFHYYTY